MIKAGNKVKIKPEWCDAPEEAEMECLVVSGEEPGKPRITIQFPLGMDINPTQTVDVEMVEVVA